MKRYKFSILFVIFFSAINSVSAGLLPTDSTSKTTVIKRNQWVDCFIVTIQGDTIHAQVKNKKDYSAEGSLLPGNEILFHMPDGSEMKLGIHTFRELNIPSALPENRKYLSLNSNPAYGNQFRLYRVVTDGTCMLLYSESNGSAGKMIVATANSGQTYNTPMKAGADEYYVYYRGKLTLVHVDDDLNLSPISKNDCLEIFKNCYALVEKITAKKAKVSNISEMVREFNVCSTK